MLDIEEREFLLFGFTEYATEKGQLAPSSLSRYKVVIEDYIDELLLNKVKKNDFTEYFNPNKLSLIRRKSNSVRPALLMFIDFLRNEKFIEDELQYLKLRDSIIKNSSHDAASEKPQTSFLTPNEIRNLFSNNVEFNSESERILFPVLCSLSFFCMFKQSDLMKLTIDDVDLKNKRIRNVRAKNENDALAEWIELNKISHSILSDYLGIRETQKVDTDRLLIFDKKEIDNKGINTVFRCMIRNGNKDLVNGKNINPGLLIKSMMLYILKSTEGKGFSNILLLQEENSYFKDAFQEYINILRVESKNENIEQFGIKEILPPNKQEYKKNVYGAYSEENDINKEDMEDFDLENERNHHTNKVTIQRLVRDSKMAQQIKNLYNHECQLCKTKMRKSDGSYSAEAHHIQPYNKIHRGDDNTHNLIVLCPNCHSQFDDFYFAIHPETKKVHCIFEEEDDFHGKKLYVKENHHLGNQYLSFAWDIFIEKKNKIETETKYTY